ncbi:MAG: hypothetical protein ACK5HP_01600 [Bacilli bacterium]
MFEDKLFEYLVATDQIDDVLGTKKEKEERQLVIPKIKNIKCNNEIKSKAIKNKKNINIKK